ncbi:HEAT repeat domain-containing protein [Myxococcota bacterium]|nr:HEAT repeat domain-containing protein [Myxococcota bacterium]
MAAFAWEGGTEHWRHLASRYMAAPSEDTARRLIEEDRVQAWIFFCECLYQEAWSAGAMGMQALGESKAVPLLKRALDALPVSLEAQRALLRALASLRAFDLLCVIASDPSVPVQMRLEVLSCLALYPHPRSARLFLEMLDSPQQRCQHLAMETLGRWQVAEAVPKMARMIREGATSVRLERLVQALAQMPLIEARDILRELLLSPHLAMRVQVARWMLRFPHEDFVHLFQLALASFPLQSPESLAFRSVLDDLQSALQSRVHRALRPYLEDLDQRLFEPSVQTMLSDAETSFPSHPTPSPSEEASSLSAWGTRPPEADEIEACLSPLSVRLRRPS